LESVRALRIARLAKACVSHASAIAALGSAKPGAAATIPSNSFGEALREHHPFPSPFRAAVEVRTIGRATVVRLHDRLARARGDVERRVRVVAACLGSYANAIEPWRAGSLFVRLSCPESCDSTANPRASAEGMSARSRRSRRRRRRRFLRRPGRGTDRSSWSERACGTGSSTAGRRPRALAEAARHLAVLRQRRRVRRRALPAAAATPR
jgi:hypothetical protein